MYRKYIKRLIDIVISLLFLLVLFPVYLLIAIMIIIFDRSQIIYKQDRTGVNGKTFKIYKFKTMKDNQNTRLR